MASMQWNDSQESDQDTDSIIDGVVDGGEKITQALTKLAEVSSATSSAVGSVIGGVGGGEVVTFGLHSATEFTDQLQRVEANQAKIMNSLQRLHQDLTIIGRRQDEMLKRNFSVKSSSINEDMMKHFRMGYLYNRIAKEEDMNMAEITLLAEQAREDVPKGHIIAKIIEAQEKFFKNWRNEELKKIKSGTQPIEELVEKMLGTMTTPSGQKGAIREGLRQQMTLARLYYWKKWEGKNQKTPPGFWVMFYLYRAKKKWTVLTKAQCDEMKEEEETIRISKI